MNDFPKYPHDRLGGPQHTPHIIPALIFRDCVEDRCTHGFGECPTADEVVCTRCFTGELPIGLVSFSARWPCEHARQEQP